LTNITTTNAGNYSVVVTGPYGMVTSMVATLTVSIPTTPPQIIVNDSAFGILSNRFGFNISGTIGQMIFVEGSTNLLNWTPLSTNVVQVNPYYFNDPWSTNFGSRFYRARLP